MKQTKKLSTATQSKHASKAAATYGWTGGAFLSAPGKMPGFTWSLPAGKTCPAGKASVKLLGDAAICSKCYAKKGNYCFAPVQACQDDRLAFLVASLREDGGDRWCRAMVAAIQATRKAGGDDWFRVHDSGDLFSVAYINAWADVARELPDVKFWVPTREWFTSDPRKVDALRELAKLPNVRVRASALALNEPAPDLDGIGTGSAVHSNPARAMRDKVFACPATIKGFPKTCAENNCTRCWTHIDAVSYMAH